MYLIAKAVSGLPAQANGLPVPYGQYVTLVGTNSTVSGGNSIAPALYVDSKLQPTRIATSADNTALVGSSAGAASQNTVSVLQSQARISAGNNPVAANASPTASTFNLTPTGSATSYMSQVGSTTLVQATTTSAADQAAAAAADLAVKEQVRCAYVKTAFTAATSQGPDSVNPDKDMTIVGGSASIFTAADYMDNDVKKTAAVMKLVMNGYAGAGTIVLSGYDYHSGNRADGETRNTHAGVIIGAILAYADAVHTPVMINIISDGSLTSTGMADTSVAGRGKLGWQGDSQQVAASIILAYSPNGRPAASINQIGSLNADGTVNATSSPGANAPNLVTQLVTLNWMALNGIDASFGSTTVFPMQGLGSATARTALTAFTKI
jgi:hypothetical protein